MDYVRVIRYENMNTERSVEITTKASIMKYGWFQMINNTVHYYQTPCNIALIVEQLSNYNSLLREQIETEEDVFIFFFIILVMKTGMHQNCLHQQLNMCLKGWKKRVKKMIVK